MGGELHYKELNDQNGCIGTFILGLSHDEVLTFKKREFQFPI